MIKLKVENRGIARWLVDDSLDQELIVSQKQEYDDKELLNSAMKILNEREKEIISTEAFGRT